MMNQMGGQSQFSDEDLRKLAILLQQMPANEGLASVTQNEAQLMKDYGGAAEPLPGTQGLGPGGDLVRSYNGKEAEESYEAAGGYDPGGFSDFGGDSGGDSGGTTGTTTGTTGTTTIQPTFDPQPEPEPDKGQFETRHWVIQARDTPEGRSGDWNAHLNAGGSENKSPQPVAAPPTKYTDKNGNEYSTQAAADDANAKIDATNAAIEGEVLTTDVTFKSWRLANKDTYPVPPSTEEQLETAFNNAKLKATDAAAIQLPKMVDSMNVYLRDNGAEVPFDTWWATIDPKPVNLSETTMRTMYAKAVFKAERKEAFTLTQEEVGAWTRPAAQMATANNFEEWWAGNGGEGGLYPTREEAEAVHKASIIGDVGKVTIGEVTAAEAPTVGAVSDVAQTTIDAISEVTDADIDKIFAGGIDEAEALLLARVEGTAVSPAEEQLKRSVENNLRMLLGATVGADADPAKVRQLKNIWADMTQEVTGKAAEIRSQESMAAEKELIALYKDKSTMKLNQRLANLEVERQTAFKNGDLELAGKLANQQTRLTHVITQANIDKDTNLANLQTMKDIAIEQGKLDLAVSLTNLQKNIAIGTVNLRVAVEQRSLDQSLAIVAFKGEMALMGLEVEIDIEEMKADLTKMGFDLTRDLAELDAATQIEVARLVGDYKAAISRADRNAQKEGAIIGMIGTAITAYGAYKGAALIAGSDIRAKTNISPGSGEVESFLDALNSYKYEYKDPNADGAGMFLGVMAQDLEKSPMGASFVKDTPRGKQVDYGHGLAAILASQANIHDRLRTLEEG